MTHEGTEPLTGAALTRARVLDAAARLIGTVGLTRATTKEIAREAGCSEAALYKHFRDKEEIFVRVLRERAPRLADAVAGLPGRAGSGTVGGHLEEVVRVAVPFYRQSFPMAGSLFASPELLAAHRRKLGDAGPHHVSSHLADYLRAEQRLGRVRAGIDPDAAAMLLIGACFHRAFLELFYADEAPAGALRPATTGEFVTTTVQALLDGILVPPHP
ncbi:TetR/AcrR family transcriptional regulator [Kitasatospora aureofaciens]|uniref:TetR/AcrR family transcriptional regulator n=1 Tax=Kitasatospora aureofaciens TaxID=1894 RepID=UPI001C477F30|nr:TetR/AcrR family transcriptional regulator [Kitasatospora aureofaciens]MBV6703006.1 TetR/AcrR family transcriptional regulator [Kitasatospora aureofaciens]